MAKGDNPIASIIQKYPFDQEQIKQLLQYNSRIDQTRNTPVAPTNIVDNHQSNIRASTPRSIPSTCAPAESQPRLPNSSSPDADVTFVDCGSRNNSDDDNDVTYLPPHSSHEPSTILNSESNPNDSAKIFVKNFANSHEAPSGSGSQDTIPATDKNDSLTNSQVLTIRANKAVTLSTVIKKFPQVAEQVANKKILFIRKSLSKSSYSTSRSNKSQVSLLKPEVLRQLKKKKMKKLKEQCKNFPVLQLQDIYKCKGSNKNQPVPEKVIENIDLEESTETSNDFEFLPVSETADNSQSLATFSKEQMDSCRSILLNQSLNLQPKENMISIDKSLDPVLDKLNNHSSSVSSVIEPLKNNCSLPLTPEGRKSISIFNNITKPSENLIGIPHISSNLDYFMLYNLICHVYRTFQANKNRFSNRLKYDQLESFYNCPECNRNFPSFLDLKIHTWAECYQSLVRRFLSYNICKVDGLLSLESILKLFEIVQSSRTSICKMCCIVFAYYCESRLNKGFLELKNSTTKQSAPVSKVDDKYGFIKNCNNTKNHQQKPVVYCFKFCLNVAKYSALKNGSNSSKLPACDGLILLSNVASKNSTQTSKNEMTVNNMTEDSNLDNMVVVHSEETVEVSEEEVNNLYSSNSNESNEITEVEIPYDCTLEEEIVTSPINDSNDTLDSDVLLPPNFETNGSFLFSRKKEKIDNSHNSNSNDSNKITNIDNSSNCLLQKDISASPRQDSNDTSDSNEILPTNFETNGSFLFSQKKELFSGLISSEANLFQNIHKPPSFSEGAGTKEVEELSSFSEVAGAKEVKEPSSFSEVAGAKEVEESPKSNHQIVESNLEEDILSSSVNKANLSDNLYEELLSSSDESVAKEVEEPPKSSHQIVELNLEEDTLSTCVNKSNEENLEIRVELENEMEDDENSFVTELEEKIKSNFGKMDLVLNHGDDENTFDNCDNDQDVLIFEQNNVVSCEFSLQTNVAVESNTQNLTKECLSDSESIEPEILESDKTTASDLLEEKDNDQIMVQENKNEVCQKKFNDSSSHESYVPKDIDNLKKIDETLPEISTSEQLKNVPKKIDSVCLKINREVDGEKNVVVVVEKEKFEESPVQNSNPEILEDFDSSSTSVVRSESEVKDCVDTEINAEALEIDSTKHKLLSDENKNLKKSFSLDPVKKIDFNDKEIICTDNTQESIAENNTSHANLNSNLDVTQECVDTEISSNKSIVVISDTSDLNDISHQLTILLTSNEDISCDEPNDNNIELETVIATNNSVKENNLLNPEINLNNEERSDYLNQQTQVTTEDKNTINNLTGELVREEVTLLKTAGPEALKEQTNQSSHKHNEEQQPDVDSEKSIIDSSIEKSMNNRHESCGVENTENLKLFFVSGDNTELTVVSKDSLSSEPVNIEQQIENHNVVDEEETLSHLTENPTKNMENVNINTDYGEPCITTQVENTSITLIEKENTYKDTNSKSVELDAAVIKDNSIEISCELDTTSKQLISTNKNLLSENDISIENSDSVSKDSEKSGYSKNQFEEVEGTKDVSKKNIKLNQNNNKEKDTSDNKNFKNSSTILEKRNKSSKVQSSKKIKIASDNSIVTNEAATVKSHLKNYNIIKNITVYIEKLDEKKINVENQSKLAKKISSEKSVIEKIKIPNKILTANLHSNEQEMNQINKIEIQNKNFKCFNTHKKKVLKVSLPNEANSILSPNLKNDCVNSEGPSECLATNYKNDSSKTDSTVELKNNQILQEENCSKKLNKVCCPSISNCSIIIEKTENKFLNPAKALDKNLESQNTPPNKNAQVELSETPVTNKSKNSECINNVETLTSESKNSKTRTVSENEKSNFEKLPRKRKKSFKSGESENKSEKIQKVSHEVESEPLQETEIQKLEAESLNVKSTDLKTPEIISHDLPESSTIENVKVTKRPYKRKIYLIKNSQVPTRRATNLAVIPESNASASPEDTSQQKIIKKCKIGFYKDTAAVSETCIFNCHVCGEVINSSWTTLRYHFERKHSCEYELYTLGPKLIRCNSNAADAKKSKKRKYSENTSANVKRKREDEQPSVSIQPTPGVSENQSKCKKCEVEFSNTVELREHIAETHRVAKKNLICLECGENFIVLSTFQAHLKSCHEVEDPLDYMKSNPRCVPDSSSDKVEPEIPSNQCHVCMEIFDSKRAVDKHLRVHGITVLNKKNIAADGPRIILNKK